MADQQSLKSIALARLKSAEALIQARDAEGAYMMMGFALECAMKSAICCTLHLPQYPDSKSEDDKFFMSHKFDRLLVISGLTDLFTANGKGFAVWSEFTKEYQGNWVETRYKELGMDEEKAKVLYEKLNGTIPGNEGICQLLTIETRW